MKQATWHFEGSNHNLPMDTEGNKQNTQFVEIEGGMKSRSAHQSHSYFLAPVRPPKRSHHTVIQQSETYLNKKLFKQQLQFKDGKDEKSICQQKKVNRKLLNLLYLQDINDVNPYIETLHQLHNNSNHYNQQQTDKVKELCYIGIGKKVISQNKISVPPYSRVNLLIRQFMIDVITEELKELQRRHPKRIYIHCNDRALGFNTTIFSEQLYRYISKEQVEGVINETNKIIQKQFISFKKKKQTQISIEVKISFWVSIIGIILLVVYVELYRNRILMILAWVLICLCILLNTVSLVIRQKGIRQSQNIIDQIQKKLTIYLNQKNQLNKSCKWKCGKDFYWLEILIPKE